MRNCVRQGLGAIHRSSLPGLATTVNISFDLSCLFTTKSVMYTTIESMRISNTLMGEKSLSQ